MAGDNHLPIDSNAVVIRLSFDSQFLRWSKLSLSLFRNASFQDIALTASCGAKDVQVVWAGASSSKNFARRTGPRPRRALHGTAAAAARILAEPTARGHLGSRQRLAARRYSPLVPIRGGGGGSARSLRVHSAHAAAAGACQERPSPLRRGRRWARSSGQEGVDAPAAARIEMGGR